MTPVEAWITVPGEYDLDEAVYHADPVVGGSLSSTGARTLITRTPAHFAYEREHGRADSDTLRFGRAAHAVVLGAGAEVVVITGSGKDPDSWNTNETKAAVKAAEEAGQTPVKPKEKQTLDAMVAAVQAHPVAGPLLARPGCSEASFVARDPESGVMCRVRIDRMPAVEAGSRLIAVDYKTAADASPDAFMSSLGKYGYHQQGAFYVDVLRWLGLADDAQFVFIAQEKAPPHLVTVGWLDAEAIEWGRVLNRKARDLFAACTESCHWPGYPDKPVALELPSWLKRQYEEADEAGAYLIREDITA